MKQKNKNKNCSMLHVSCSMESGFSLIELMIGVAIVASIGLGVFTLLNTSLRLLAENKAKESAIALANEQIELIRNLSYASVGVVGGPVTGNIEPIQYTTRNDIAFTLTTNVIYVDDPFDGTQGGDPDDTSPNDYKKVFVTAGWTRQSGSKMYQLITNIAPPATPAQTASGTLRITVLDASGNPVDLANVHIVNNSVSPTVDTTVQTDSNGMVTVSGLLASQESYSISVTKTGYTTDYTCSVEPLGNNCNTSEGNLEPAKPHFSVIDGEVTEATMVIDEVSSLTINTLTQNLPTEWRVNTDTTTEDQNNVAFSMCPSNNNYFFVWVDERNSGNPRIYSQQYSQTPTAQWTPDLDISSANDNVVSDVGVDDACNMYVVWGEEKTGNEDIYFDKFDSTANGLWTGSKKVDTDANSSDQKYPQVLVHDNPDYEYILWQDDRNDSADIFFNKFDTDGDAIWTQELQVNAYTQSSVQEFGVFDLSSQEDVYFAWQDFRNGNYDVYAQLYSVGTSVFTGTLSQHHLDDGQSASTFQDSINNYDGSCSGGNCPSHEPSGKINTAFDFDGNNDYIEVAHDNAFLVDSGSIALWFYPQQDDEQQALWSKDSNGYDTGGHLTIYIDDDNAIRARIQSTSSSYYATTNDDIINLNQWNSLVVTFGSGGLKLYHNGYEEASNTYTGGLGTSSGGDGNFEPIAIGGSSWVSGNQVVTPVVDEFEGYIDEVLFLNRELQPSEVLDFHNSSGFLSNDQKVNTNTAGTPNPPTISPPTIATTTADLQQLHLDDGLGATTFDDSSTTGVDGTCTNCPVHTSSGYVNSAFTFDGNNDVIEVAHDSAFLVDEGTVGLWFKASTINVQQGLWSKDSSGFDTGGHLTLQIDSNNALTVRLQSTTNSYYATTGSGLVQQNTWHSIYATFGSEGLKLYFDGNLAAQNSYTGGLGTSSGGAGNFEPIALGADTRVSGNLTVNPTENHFEGSIDEVSMFSTQLSPEQIQLLHSITLKELLRLHLDDGLGATTFDDSTSYANDGTCSQCPINDTSGVFSSAFQFDGSNDFIEVAHQSQYFIEQGSVALWFKTNSATTRQGLIGKDSSGFDTGGHLMVDITSSGGFRYRLQEDDSDHNEYSSTGIVTTGVWHSLVATFGTDGMKLFYDGNEVISGTYTGGLGTSSGGAGNFEPIVIGANSWSSGNLSATPIAYPFNGSIDEVVMWNWQLSQTDALQFHNAGSGGESANQKSPDVAVDENDLPIFVWQDNRNGNDDIYAQYYDEDWIAQWAQDVRVNSDTGTASQVSPVVGVNCDNDILIAWQDNRNGDNDIYIQKLDINGNKILENDKRVNLNTNGEQKNPDLLTNDLCNVVVSWEDNTTGDYDIRSAQYAAHLEDDIILPNVPLVITGSKKLGNNPILPKYTNSASTNSLGVLNLTNLEWDSYAITTSTSLLLYDAEPPLPISINPNSTNTINLYLSP